MSETLITAHGIRLQRIISFGQVSPEGFWYDQKEAEWVMLPTGRARLVIAGEAEVRVLGPGDLRARRSQPTRRCCLPSCSRRPPRSTSEIVQVDPNEVAIVSLDG